MKIFLAKRLNELRTDGILTDLAPTLLEVMGLPIPKEMTGKSLIAK